MPLAGFQYRLQPLLDRKLDVREDAERKVAACQREVRTEQKRLADLESRVLELQDRKTQFRSGMLAAGSVNGTGATFRRDYLKGLDQDIEAARDAVFSQKLNLDEAEERLGRARNELAEATREVEVLEKHRERLEQRHRREAERKEAIEQDEIGNMLYLSRRRNT